MSKKESVSVTAPGKLFLIGEHAVVYGQPALLTAIDLRMNVNITTRADEKITIKTNRPEVTTDLDEVLALHSEAKKKWEEGKSREDFSDYHKWRKSKKDGYIKIFVAEVLSKFDYKNGLDIEIEGDLPYGSGLGSSAVVAVCLVKGLDYLTQSRYSDKKLNGLAYEVEELMSGKVSGADNTLVYYGGMMEYLPEEKERFNKLELDTKILDDHFVLFNTGRPNKSTGEMVQAVRNLDERVRDEAVKKIGKLTTGLKTALKNSKLSQVISIINQGQEELFRLGVSSEGIDQVVDKVKKIGGGAKLCGAGGGGIVLVGHEDKEKLLVELKKLPGEIIETKFGGDGVRIEN